MKNMKFIYKSVLLIVVLVIGTLSSTLAQEPPVPQNRNLKQLVVDDVGVFSEAERQRLERELIAFSDTTSNQIVVVTMNDLQGYEPWEVAQNIGKTWEVGQSGFDNGMVILIKPKTRDSRGQVNIQVGYGLEGAIPDATAKLIVENEIIPLFKAGQMYRGVDAGIKTLKALAVGEYNSDEYANTRSSSSNNFAPIIFILFVFIFAFINKAGGARKYARRNNLSFWAAMALMNSGSGHGGSYGNFTSGGGGFGGGGFGGFGGGGFGGGGAGGSW